MSDLTVSTFFTRGTGIPATGLTLADIDLYLTEQDKATGVDTVIWDGTQNPTEEIDNIGAYIRIYGAADFAANNYFARGTYTGVVVLDVDHVQGATDQIDPWDTPLPGAYIAGQAGYILANVCACVTAWFAKAASSLSSVIEDHLIVLRGDTLIVQFTGIGNITTRDNIWFTIKGDKDNADNVSIVQCDEDTGLLFIDGEAATVPGNATIAVTDAVAGDVTVRVEAVEMAKITTCQRTWYDLQVLWLDTTVGTVARSRAKIIGDVSRVTS